MDEEEMCYEDIDQEYRTGNFPTEGNTEFDEAPVQRQVRQQ
jgi:hypothetical protein